MFQFLVKRRRHGGRSPSSCTSMWLLQALALLPLLTSWTAALCPSACSGHGICTPSNTCVCFDGYTGFDCFARTCPTALPWTDVATADDTMRTTPRECAHRGTCRRDTGRCDCDEGFAGHACEKLVAPCHRNCNGHGRCLSLREIGPMRNDATLVATAVYETMWDADRVVGCVCDAGYTGPGCTKRVCPFGDDPITTGQVSEIQALSCQCATCVGTFTLSFRGETTRALDPVTETGLTLQHALEQLLTIRAVSVSVSSGAVGSLVCSATGVSTLITFTLEHGDVPALVVDASRITGGTSAIAVQADGTPATYGGGITQVGTKEWEPCSARGRCDSFNGICTCNEGFDSSNGLGATGDVADCGYRFGGAMTSCPFNYGSACSGHGRCSDAPLFQCTCDDSYTGHDCSRRRCARGRAWWDEPQTDNVAHLNLVECSNAGECDEIGICRCFPGFEGVACDRLSCPTSDAGVCSGRGQCKTARELAALTPTADFGVAGFVYGVDPNAVATWDADMVRGCYCDKVHWKRGESVRYTGHDCRNVPCPRGDDPWTGGQLDDLQTVACAATGGSFTLTFRGETTAPVAFSASAAAVKAALESLRTISSVSVVFSAGVTAACTATGNVITVTFISPSGNLPLLVIDTTALTISGGPVAPVVAVKMQTGTKESIVCNNRGRCDDDSGMCICALHHASSDGRGGYGIMDDCGAVDKFMTHGEL